MKLALRNDAPMSLKAVPIRPVLWLASAICTGFTWYFSYQSGCAGDLKSAMVGDIQRALVFDGYAAWSFYGSLGFGIAAIFYRERTLLQVMNTFAYVVVATVATWMIAMSFEGWGLRTCFPL